MNKSEDVKREIFDALCEDTRFKNMLENVADCLRKGQGPVVIESFSTLIQKAKPHDELWELLFTPKDSARFEKHWFAKDRVSIQVSLNAEIAKPFQEAKLSIKIPNEKYTVKQKLTAECDLMKYMAYFGYRDKNYFQLFFKMLGYSVKEGNLGDKYGLLISFDYGKE